MLDIDTIEITNQTDQMDFKVSRGKESLEFTVKAIGAIGILNALTLRLLQRKEHDVREGLQCFALQDIQAKLHQGYTPYLEYKLENGMAFGSGLEREKLERLHSQLGEILGKK